MYRLHPSRQQPHRPQLKYSVVGGVLLVVFLCIYFISQSRIAANANYHAPTSGLSQKDKEETHQPVLSKPDEPVVRPVKPTPPKLPQEKNTVPQPHLDSSTSPRPSTNKTIDGGSNLANPSQTQSDSFKEEGLKEHNVKEKMKNQGSPVEGGPNQTEKKGSSLPDHTDTTKQGHLLNIPYEPTHITLSSNEEVTSNYRCRQGHRHGSTTCFVKWLAIKETLNPYKPPYVKPVAYNNKVGIPTLFPADDTRGGLAKHHGFGGITVKSQTSNLSLKNCQRLLRQSLALVYHSVSLNNPYHLILNNVLPLYARIRDAGYINYTNSNVVLYQLDPLSSPPPRMLPLLQALSDYPIQYLSSFNNNGNDKQPAKLNQTEQVNKTGGLKQSSPDTRNTSVDNNRNQGGESHATENKPTQNEVALCAEDAIVGYSGATVSWNEAKAFLTHRLNVKTPSTKTRDVNYLNVLFITRGDNARGRRILNQDELVGHFQSSNAGLRTSAVDLSLLPFPEQLQLIMDTDILIGVHGAGLTWALFLPPTAMLIQIVPYGAGDGELSYLYDALAHLNQIETISLPITDPKAVHCISENEGNSKDSSRLKETDQKTNKSDISNGPSTTSEVEPRCKGTIWMDFMVNKDEVFTATLTASDKIRNLRLKDPNAGHPDHG